MTTSQNASLLSELVGDSPISEMYLAFLAERARNSYYDFVVRKFLEAEKTGLTQADLARKIRIEPPQLSRILGAPGNWTIATIAKLLAGICAEELQPSSRSFLNRPHGNYTQADVLADIGLPSLAALDTGHERTAATEETIDARIKPVTGGGGQIGATTSA